MSRDTSTDTVRAAITGLRHAGREVARSKNESGQTFYRLTPDDTQDRGQR